MRENLPAQSQAFHHTVIIVIKFSGSYSPLQKQISPTQTRENGFLQGDATLARGTAPDCQLPLNPSAQCTLKYWLSEHSCEHGGTMIHPSFLGLRWSCKAAVSSSNGNTVTWTWAPGSLGHSIYPGWSSLLPTWLCFLSRQLKESNTNLGSQICSLQGWGTACCSGHLI